MSYLDWPRHLVLVSVIGIAFSLIGCRPSPPKASPPVTSVPPTKASSPSEAPGSAAENEINAAFAAFAAADKKKDLATAYQSLTPEAMKSVAARMAHGGISLLAKHGITEENSKEVSYADGTREEREAATKKGMDLLRNLITDPLPFLTDFPPVYRAASTRDWSVSRFLNDNDTLADLKVVGDQATGVVKHQSQLIPPFPVRFLKIDGKWKITPPHYGN
jgi:hypothetical protein